MSWISIHKDCDCIADLKHGNHDCDIFSLTFEVFVKSLSPTTTGFSGICVFARLMVKKYDKMTFDSVALILWVPR